VGEIVVLQVGLLVPMCRAAFGLAPNSWFLLGPRDRKRDPDESLYCIWLDASNLTD